MPIEYKRVRLDGSGHEATVAEVGDGMTVIDKPAVDNQGLPLEAKFKETVATKAAAKRAAKAAASENPSGGDSATDKEDS